MRSDIFPFSANSDLDCSDGSDVELSNLGNVSSLIRPCRLSATRIQLHLNLRQLSRTLSKEPTCETANAEFEKLCDTVIRNSMSPEEAYFVVEMTRGLDDQLAGKVCISVVLDHLGIKIFHSLSTVV